MGKDFDIVIQGASGITSRLVAGRKATMVAAAKNPRVLDRRRSPVRLTPGFEGPKQPSGNKPMVDDALGQFHGEGIWVAPFVMAAINTKNVHRSNFLPGQACGADFVCDAMLITGHGAKGERSPRPWRATGRWAAKAGRSELSAWPPAPG